MTKDALAIALAKPLKLQYIRWKALVSATLLVLGLTFTIDPAFAGLLSWVGAVAIVVGVGIVVAAVVLASPLIITVAATTVVISTGVLIAAGTTIAVAGAAAIVIDQKTPPSAPPVLPPAAPVIPAPPQPANPPGDVTLNNFSHIPAPGNEADALASAVNSVLDAGNTLISDAASQPEEFVQDFGSFTSAYDPVASEFSSLFGGLEAAAPGFTSFSQTDIDAILADIATSGLPVPVIDALTTVGFSTLAIQSLTDFIAGTEVNIAAPTTVTTSQLLAEATDLRFAVPEPSTLLLLGSGLAALLASFGRRPASPTFAIRGPNAG